jgi:hypothetical protein
VNINATRLILSPPLSDLARVITENNSQTIAENDIGRELDIPLLSPGSLMFRMSCSQLQLEGVMSRQ